MSFMVKDLHMYMKEGRWATNQQEILAPGPDAGREQQSFDRGANLPQDSNNMVLNCYNLYVQGITAQ